MSLIPSIHSVAAPHPTRTPPCPQPHPIPGEFQKRLVSQFNYSVTPLVFDLTLEIQSPLGLASENGWRILQAYGSPNNDSTLSPDGKILSVGIGGVV